MPKEQGELPNVRPAHIIRLEEIEDEIEKHEEKISERKEEIAELKAEAVKLWQDNSMSEPHVRGSNEWEVKIPLPKFMRKRHKIDRQKEEKKARKQEKASA